MDFSEIAKESMKAGAKAQKKKDARSVPVADSQLQAKNTDLSSKRHPEA